MKKNVSVLLGLVLIFVLGLAAVACSDDGKPVDPPEITGIYAEGVETQYDGAAHGIQVLNTQSGDVIYYSLDKVTWSTENMQFTLPDEYKVYFRVERSGYKTYEGSAVVLITKAVLSGISAADATFIYDGNKHGITVKGTEVGDEITYSSAGESAVGEYIIYYTVSRAYGEYKDECKLTILPKIQGEYVNSENGGIILTVRSAIIDGAELNMTYGISGAGMIGETEFKVEGNTLTLDGKQYEKLAESEKIYRLNVNGRAAYFKGNKTGAEVKIEFKDGGAEISSLGKIITTEPNVNFAEGLAIADYSTCNVVMTISQDTDIVLTEREENNESDKYSLVVYDGEYHDVCSDGAQLLYNIQDEYTDDTPRYKEVGKYVVEAVVIKDGYLPQIISVTLEIVENIYGTYYNAKNLIEISSERTSVNYEHQELKYIDGQWTLNGQSVKITDNGIEIAGEIYAKRAEEKILAVKINDDMTVLRHESMQFFITADYNEGAVTIADESDNTLLHIEIDGKIENVIANGEILLEIEDGMYIVVTGQTGKDGITRLSIGIIKK